MKTIRTLFVASVLASAASAASATVIIDNSTQGLYNNGLGDLSGTYDATTFPGPNSSEGDPTINPIAEPDLSLTPQLGADWLNGDYTGGSWSAGPVAIPTSWAINTETAIVYEIFLTSASNLLVELGVDNGIYTWLNGDYQFGAMAPGGSSLSEYSYTIANLSAGTHYFQVLREDHGGSTGYDIRVTATEVPEPATLGLLGLGLLGLALGRKKS